MLGFSKYVQLEFAELDVHSSILANASYKCVNAFFFLLIKLAVANQKYLMCLHIACVS